MTLLGVALSAGLAGYIKGFNQGLVKALEILDQVGQTAEKFKEDQNDQTNS